MNKKLKIVVLTDWFSEKMGYIESELSHALAELGHDVHVISGNIRPYYDSGFYKEVYEPYLGPPSFEPGVYDIGNYKLHALPINHKRNGKALIGLEELLQELAPDIVQCFDMLAYTTMQAVKAKLLYKCEFKLFTGNHTVKSVFPQADQTYPVLKKYLWKLRLGIKGRIVNHFMEKCYSATIDAQEIAEEFFGVSKSKSEMHPLGVNTNKFTPYNPDIHRQERKGIRGMIGVDNNDILCIYTGRFTKDKMPDILAKAITEVSKTNNKIKALFIGDGELKDIILSSPNCIVRDFMHSDKLPAFYRAADIGVWPAQESLSMLDAAACGIPIIVSDRIKAIERIDGNGLQYEYGNINALAETILKLVKDNTLRRELGGSGAVKIKNLFSWQTMAAKKLQDYYRSIQGQ